MESSKEHSNYQKLVGVNQTPGEEGGFTERHLHKKELVSPKRSKRNFYAESLVLCWESWYHDIMRELIREALDKVDEGRVLIGKLGKGVEVLVAIFDRSGDTPLSLRRFFHGEDGGEGSDCSLGFRGHQIDRC